jgi:hypothetical protein
MRTISGTVYSGWDHEPLQGAHLVLELNVDGDYFPLGDGTTTDANGFYSFTFVPGGLDNERIRVSHISHYDGNVYPHFMSENDGDIYLQIKSHEQPEMTVQGWVSHNSNMLWLITFGLLMVIVIIHETGGWKNP